MFLRTTVTKWKSSVGHDMVRSDTEFFLNTGMMTDIRTLSASSSRMLFADTVKDDNMKTGYLECNSTVAEIRVAGDTVLPSKFLDLSVFPNNKTSKTAVDLKVQASDIVWARANGAGDWTWIYYDTNKGEMVLALADLTMDEFEVLVALSTPTNLAIDDDGVLTWDDASTTEEGYQIWVSEDGGAFYLLDTVGEGVEIYTDTTTTGSELIYKVRAYSGTSYSGFSNTVSFSWLRYWESLNFSPDSDGATNVAAINQALTDKSYVKIITPGVYDFDNTIWIPSNTTLEVCEGVTFRKETGSSYCHIIGNKGMLTNTRDTNINIYGGGVILKINGIDTYSYTDTDMCPILRMRAVLNFHQVDNFILDDIAFSNIEMENQFHTMWSDCHYGTISNFNLYGKKDGLNICASTDLTFTNLTSCSYDDAMFLGLGYPNTCVNIGDCERITVDGWAISCPPELIGGNGIKLYSGSWDDWTNGRTYHDLEYCVGSNGIVYGKGYDTGGDMVASVEPTHTSGAVTGADGIEWWKMDGTGYASNSKDVNVKNVTLSSRKIFCDISGPYFTPGTEGNGLVDDIVFDNISVYEGYDVWFISNKGFVGTFTVKNSNIDIVDGASSGIFSYEIAHRSADKVIFDTCVFDLTDVGKLIFFNQDYATLGELELINTTVKNSTLINASTKTNCIATKLTASDSVWEHTGNQKFGRGVLLGDNTIFTRCTINGLDRIVQTYEVTAMVRFVDCEFISCKFIAYVSVASCVVTIISTGTTYSEPRDSGYLFVTTQEQDSLQINLSDSSGTVTPAKVRYDSKTKVIACDLAYV